MNFEANLPVITNVRAQNEAVYTGTAKELQEKKIKINGVEVDALGLRYLAKYSLVKVIGTEAKPESKRGRAGKILAFTPGVEFKVEM